MAATHQIYIVTDINSDRLLRIVEDALGLDHFRDPEFRSEHYPSLVGRYTPGLCLTANAEDSIGAEVMEEWLGFRPTLRLGFRMDRSQDDVESIYRDMLRATSAVLETEPGDAALVSNGEAGLLIRRGGRVIVWDDLVTRWANILSELRVPYELGRPPRSGDAPP